MITLKFHLTSGKSLTLTNVEHANLSAFLEANSQVHPFGYYVFHSKNGANPTAIKAMNVTVIEEVVPSVGTSTGLQ